MNSLNYGSKNKAKLFKSNISNKIKGTLHLHLHLYLLRLLTIKVVPTLVCNITLTFYKSTNMNNPLIKGAMALC